VNNINGKGFVDFVSAGIVCIDFYADWCQPCKTMTPVLERLALKHTDIKFAKVNIDEENALASEMAITSIPTLLLIKDGKIVDVVVGLISESKLDVKLEGIK
jgi:thioredoxin 1